MAGLPEGKVPIEGGWGSSLLGIALTSLSLSIMAILVIYPQTRAESFVLSLITAACLMGTGVTILTLVSDYALILSSVSLFLLLLSWRLRRLDTLWLMLLSVFTFLLSVIVHRKTPGRRQKGRVGRLVDEPRRGT